MINAYQACFRALIVNLNPFHILSCTSNFLRVIFMFLFFRCCFFIVSFLYSIAPRLLEVRKSSGKRRRSSSNFNYAPARAQLSRNKMSSVSARAVPCHDAIYEILARVSVFKHGQPQLQRLQLQWPHTVNIIQESSRHGWVVRSTVT